MASSPVAFAAGLPLMVHRRNVRPAFTTGLVCLRATRNVFFAELGDVSLTKMVASVVTRNVSGKTDGGVWIATATGD